MSPPPAGPAPDSTRSKDGLPHVRCQERSPAVRLPGRRARAGLVARRGGRRLRRPLQGAPATAVYLFTVTMTSWTLRGADPALVHELLLAQSTNLHNMLHRPVHVLVSSAFWLDDADAYWPAAGQFLLVMAPAERWLGTRRLVVVAVAGHVLATLVTSVGIAVALSHGLLPHRVVRVEDVGISYAFYAVAAACTWRAGRRRFAWAGLLAAYLLAVLLWRQTFTDYGHLTAAAIGFVLHPRDAADRSKR